MRFVGNFCITLLALLLGVGNLYPHGNNLETRLCSPNDGDIVGVDTLVDRIRQNKRFENIEVHFRLDKYYLDLDYMGNRASLQRFAHKIDSIGISRIDSVVVVSQSSPEGVYEHNLWLSRNRANTMRKHIQDTHPQLRDRLTVYPDGESWLRLREYVKNDTLMKKETIEKVISIIDSDINIGTKKWRMQQLPVYRYLLSTYYPRIRNSSFYILYYSEEAKPEPPVVEEPIVEEPAPAPVEEEKVEEPPVVEMVVPVPEVWTPRVHLKTNAVGLGLAIANVGAEIDFAKHWSFTLPIYYSAWNYFRSTIKFRTFSIQPEFRYWLSQKNDGFFAGAHFGLTYYNFAFNGDYRYQDHDGTTPAIGGGLSVGYRMPISKNNRWRMEFSLGAGVYPLHYDVFHNTKKTKDGLMTETIKKTYWGIDQAAISFMYTFDLKKKGGLK